MDHDGLRRAYRFYVPASLAERPPLVILLHGGGGSMNQLFRPNAGGTQEWVAVAEDHGFILLVPNGVNPATGSATGDEQRWNDCRADPDVSAPLSNADDTGFILALIRRFAENHRIDRGAVFATGSSNGGMMAYRLAAEIPDQLAGIAAVIANAPGISACPEVGLGSGADEGEAVPVMMVNGTADEFVPFEGGSIIGGRGMVRSSAETLEGWKRSNRTAAEPFETLDFPSLDPGDATSVRCQRFASAAGEERVRYCVVEGGGHTTPSIRHPIPRWVERVLGPQNRDMEGAREAWSFLQQFR